MSQKLDIALKIIQKLIFWASLFCIVIGLVGGLATLAGIIFDLPFCSAASVRPWTECLASNLGYGLLFLFPLIFLLPALGITWLIRKFIAKYSN